MQVDKIKVVGRLITTYATWSKIPDELFTPGVCRRLIGIARDEKEGDLESLGFMISIAYGGIESEIFVLFAELKKMK